MVFCQCLSALQHLCNRPSFRIQQNLQPFLVYSPLLLTWRFYALLHPCFLPLTPSRLISVAFQKPYAFWYTYKHLNIDFYQLCNAFHSHFLIHSNPTFAGVLFVSLCMLRILYWSHAVKKQKFLCIYVGIPFLSLFSFSSFFSWFVFTPDSFSIEFSNISIGWAHFLSL